MFTDDKLIGLNHEQLLLVELDHELQQAPDAPLFSQNSSSYKALRHQAMQANTIHPKKGMFSRAYTIQDCIDKHTKGKAKAA